MRKIPVTANGDYNTIVGFLELNDKITDEMLMDMYVSWMWVPDRKKVLSVSLVAMQSVPTTTYLGSVIKCVRCNENVPYGSYHARGIEPFGDVTWTCAERKSDAQEQF